MGIPVSWTDRESFADDLHRLVQAANSVPPRPLPVGIAAGLSDEDARMVENTYQTLIEVCRDEKDSVWGWYFQNIVGPSKMRRRKANRILANPPWVRMSHIQTPERKADLEKLAEELGFWGHGKSNTSFDISSLFVKRCAANYLAAGGGALAAWVLPQAALDGSNWQNVREDPYIKEGARERMDLGRIRKAPFTVESCVWLQTAAENGARDGARTANAEPPTLILTNAAGKPRLEPLTAWEDAKDRVEWIAAPKKISEKAVGLCGQSRGPLFRNGATLFPHCLVMVDRDSLEIFGGLASFTTMKSDKRPWSERGTLAGANVPTGHWIRDMATSSTDLFPFALRRELGKADLAAERKRRVRRGSGERGVLAKRELGLPRQSRDWRQHAQDALETDEFPKRSYAPNRRRQSGVGDALIKVVYNVSGRIGLRSARMAGDMICNHKLYHYTCRTESEAAYLAAMLNADCLQEAYRQSQRTRRDFAHHFWRAVPLPRYDGRDDAHLSLSALCEEAESTASAARDGLRANVGQIKASATIHAALRESGVSARIDAVVGEVMGEWMVASG